MNILLLNANQRGVGTYFRALYFARELVRRGHQTTLYTVSRDSLWQARCTNWQGVEVVEGPALGYRALPGWGSGPLDITLRLRELIGGRYDVIYGFEYHPNVAWPVYLTRGWKGYRFVSDWCDWYAGGSNVFRDWKLAHRVDAFFEERIRRVADCVTVISTVLRDRACSVGVSPERIRLIEEGVDTDYIRPLPRPQVRRQLGVPADVPVALTITDSNMSIPVTIFACTLQVVPQAWLIILGKRHPEARRTAVELGIADHVIETGYVADEDLPRWLACADVCFLPMADTLINRARWPHKINDYLAAGRATVINPVGDITRLFQENTIGAMAPYDPDGFAVCLAELLTDRERCAEYGAQARRVMVEQFDWRVLGGRIEEAVVGS
jgi:glycosyltransferase involved in cell wall biosynthesis